ncbi:Ubiquitin system component Cue [Trema orientale]|uniref:Ubiquitin system component Cue n=1 Tax=Trema orientale TaxID=63057 RepID=A0A2P5EX24_TREOI|nr:Ubiquitin system component Cue [Trema orientale]
MSAAVCGSKRSFFEDLPPSPPLTKRLRCSSSTSPIRFSAPSLLDQLRDVFPDMDLQKIRASLPWQSVGSFGQLLERALEECGNDLDAAIKSLNDLRLRSAEENPGPAEDSDATVEKGVNDGDVAVSENPSAHLPVDGAEWVNLFVNEMMNATSPDDVRARASRVLEILEKSISARAGAEAAQSFQKENMLLKEQLEGLLRENTILKHAVAIQHERQKQYEDKNQELQQLKQLVAQYQEQLRTLEVNNYALTMHLKQAQQSNSIPGRFHPDVF